jgi:mRNA-degrading endonuclease RelE of RelBE toxin-antitoxin system
MREVEYLPAAYRAILALNQADREGVFDKIDEIRDNWRQVNPLGSTAEGDSWTISRSKQVIVFEPENGTVIIVTVTSSAAFFGS